MALNTFPDVNITVIDKSNTPTTTSRFRCGLIGPAEKGPVNVATPVNSIREFFSTFGQSLPGVFLSNAVQLVAGISDGATVVRVAHEYTVLNVSGAQATGVANATTLQTPNAALFQANDYIRVSQIGSKTTANARVISVSGNTLSLDPAVPLKDTYTAANVDRSRVLPVDGDPSLGADAANNAESFLNFPTWDTTPLGGNVTTVLVSGSKSSFQVTVNSNFSQLVGALAPGDTVRLDQTGLVTTRELMVKEIIPPVPGVNGAITFEPVNRSDIGYHAISLQDSYTAATITKMLSEAAVGYHLLASNPGTWANSDGVSTGLIVKIVPGSLPDTKKMQVFEDSGLVEEIDNLSNVPTITDPQTHLQVPNPSFYTNAVNGLSAFVQFALADSTDPTSLWLGGGSTIEPMANTRNPWKVSNPTVNVAAFTGGFNGENVIDSDYIGTIDPVTQLPSGLKIFEDKELNIENDVICAPGVTSVAVAQEIDRINRAVNMFGVFDIPAHLNLRQATDWSNGAGLFTNNGKLDTYTIGEFWNWGTMVDAFTGNRVSVPPSCGALRCLAYTFDAFAPGWAAAGETRGLIPEFLAVEYPRTDIDSRNASYRNGSVVNSIILNRNRIMLFGNATTQRANSKLSSINNVIAVNTILRNMYKIGRKYLFDPIDDILLGQIYTDYRNLLLGYKGNRVVEDFSLVIDKSNNTPDDRNNRRVNVDFQIITIDALEELNINATVLESGATLNSVQ